MEPALVALLESKLEDVRTPTDTDKVYKDECIYSFTAINNSNDGLYVCLNKFWAFNRSHMKEYHKISGNTLFLRIRRVKTSTRKSENSPQSEAKDSNDQPPAKISRKDSNEDEYENQLDLIVMPDFQSVSLPSDDLPQKIQDSIAAIQEKPSAPVSDLLLEDDPLFLEMNGKQYTSEDEMYQSSLQQPLVPDPIIVTNWRGRSDRGNGRNFDNNRGRDRGHRDRDGRDRGWGRPSGSSHGHSGGGDEGSRNEVRFHRPWR